MFVLSKDQAMRRRRKDESRWERARDRLEAVPVKPEIFPRFTFESGATIFTIGSCFARNIERQLSRLGYNVPTLKLKIPHEEAESANGILNKYTPPAVLQDLQWAQRVIADGKVTEANTGMFLQESSDGLVFDNNLSGQMPVTKQRFYQRREEIAEIYRELQQADCATITLGFIEAWFDKGRNLYLQSAPTHRDRPEDFELHILDYATSRDMIMQSIKTLREINPKIRILLTTSPVPLGSTFSGNDVLVANMHSKSVLRALCGDLYYAGIEEFDYFPSYEMVMLTKSAEVWAADLIHIPETTVEKIAALLAKHYFKQSRSDQAFNQSYAALRRSKPATALDLARDAAAQAPDSIEARSNLGYLLWKNGRRREAETVANDVLAANPNHPVALFVLARLYEDRGKLEDALASMQKALDACMRREAPLSFGLTIQKLARVSARLATNVGKPALATELATKANRDRPERARKTQAKSDDSNSGQGDAPPQLGRVAAMAARAGSIGAALFRRKPLAGEKITQKPTNRRHKAGTRPRVNESADI